jgi:hypothetical protein
MGDEYYLIQERPASAGVPPLPARLAGDRPALLGMIFTALPIRLRPQVSRQRQEVRKASRHDSRETC